MSTSAISGGDLSCRAFVKSTDEIGELAGAFSHMAETIERMVKTPGFVKVIVMNTCEPIGEAGRGTGLGLAITIKIVERHQGSLNATYEEGKLIVEMFLPEKIS